MAGRKVGLRVDGLDELESLLTDFTPAEARRISRRVTYGVAGQARDKMRAAAPVDKGTLRKSIKVFRPKAKRNSATAEVRADKSGSASGKGYHYHFVEHGTEKWEGHPFARKIVAAMQANIDSLLVGEWDKQLAAELKRRARGAKK